MKRRKTNFVISVSLPGIPKSSKRATFGKLADLAMQESTCGAGDVKGLLSSVAGTFQAYPTHS